MYAFRAEPTEVVWTGFDFGPLFLLLDDAIKCIAARRVVLDTIEARFGMFNQRPSRTEVSLMLARKFQARGSPR